MIFRKIYREKKKKASKSGKGRVKWKFFEYFDSSNLRESAKLISDSCKESTKESFRNDFLETRINDDYNNIKKQKQTAAELIVEYLEKNNNQKNKIIELLIQANSKETKNQKYQELNMKIDKIESRIDQLLSLFNKVFHDKNK
ncbi:hypothetical protein HERIO_2024 [Hepatospora eriocheir]|uniref:Uncharacterized protein n=1 Tax=Hepatospora eriocheir TaxID=1081669 RepID=A0A1X0Q8A8_9MICR|nr:hypothetical protein HERIO_2024 [Hepatospora eriocheir]